MSKQTQALQNSMAKQVLERLDTMIKGRQTAARINRDNGNSERATFLDGEASGLSRAYLEMKKVFGEIDV